MNAGEHEEREHELSHTYIPKLRTFVEMNFRSTGEDTDDIVQAILEKALFRINLYDSRYSFATWVYSIAANHCRDLLRRRRRHGGLTEPLVHPDLALSHYPGPEELSIAEQEKSRLRRIFRLLPERERQVLFLSIYEELGFREISRIMNIPVGTAKYLKHKARSRIRTMWEEEDEP